MKQRIIKILFKLIFLINILCLNVEAETNPKFIEADYIEYNARDKLIFADGNIRVLKDDNFLKCNNLVLDLNQDTVFSYGNVTLFDPKNNLSVGDNLILKDKLNDGIINGLTIKFGDNILLTSKTAERLNKDQVILYQTEFTPCKILCNQGPFWQLSAGKTELDYNKHTISYNNMVFKVYNTPLFYTPYLWHAMPNAPAKSGLLVPSIERNQFKIPFYYRMKPNIDFTLAPRYEKKALILEFEARHRLLTGEYIIRNNFGEVPYKNTKIHSNYLTAIGNFANNNFYYGVNLNFVSDKAFLKNYFHKHESYLQSSLYLNKIHNEDYLAIRGIHFRDLKEKKIKDMDALVLPLIQNKNIYNLTEDKNTYLKLENLGSFFHQHGNLNLLKNGFNFSLNKDSLYNGFLFNLSLGSREDIYFINDKNHHQSKTIARFIPYGRLKWSYPLINFLNEGTLLIEPTVNIWVSPKYNAKKDGKFLINDANCYELTENNIFHNNRYSGLDYYEFGKQISYGLNSHLMSKKNNLISIFVGQLNNLNLNYHNCQKIYNIGVLQFKTRNNIGMYYKFKKDSNFSSAVDELGMNMDYKKLSLNLSFIRLNHLKKIYLNKNVIMDRDNIQQTSSGINYKINENWSIGSSMQFEFKHKHPEIVYQSLRVTYANECVSMGFKINEDYTSDKVRGIKKTRDKSFYVNFKVLNM